ncbi:MAG: polar amino acid transport system permease protein [Pseudonocardiales bacterium]|nr:amino acid transporter permease [Jatrophihabitans sp.]MDT4951102.1 polar amino acid transport system permease protein [Pseudonocardiales bacterium]
MVSERFVMATLEHKPEVAARPERIRAIPKRHPGRWAVALVIVVLGLMLLHTILSNPRWQWGVVGDYFTSRRILAGLLSTFLLTAIAMAVGIVLGVVLAVMRLSANPLMRSAASAYIWFFRGTPVFVQIIFWFNISALFPKLSLGIPFGPEFVSGSANTFITPFLAAILALGLNEAAYMAEIVRAGIISVDPGQTEAAQALGMSRILTLRRIVLPRAMRVIIPPTGNQAIGMLKTTSLVSVIAYTELLYSAQLIYSANYKTIPLLLVASLWYLLATTVLSIGQYYIERRFGRGNAHLSHRGVMLRVIDYLRQRRRIATDVGGRA